ncbi:MAG: chromosomal replication initiator protein DnaA [Mycoplasmoidaceae bacterium]|nr:chromosomal replication initiator protein DnaA [Mycoplasmoidaceae bacterium]
MANQILGKIEKNLDSTIATLREKSPNKEFFDKFVATLKIKDVSGNVIFLLAKNNFSKQVILNDYVKDIQKHFNSIENTSYEFNVLSLNEGKVLTTKMEYKPIGKVVGVNRDYTFDNLVIGAFNNSACLAGKQVTTDHFISPLFISASVGLGKTHLLHAIGNEFVKAYPDKSVKYISSDDFSRQIYNALISDDKSLIEQIKDEYFSYDLLLIDDIQILSGRTKINELLFVIFNNALKNNKYIVFTSDKNIDLLVGFEERIKSRFHSGITLTIQKPDIENVVEIINKKVEESNKVYTFSPDATSFIARRNTNDIRRLIGDINQIFFFAANNLPKYSIIDLDNVRSILAPTNQQEISLFGYDMDPNIIIEQVCNSYGVKVDMVKSKSKLKHLITPRNVCMYVLRNKFNMTYSQIGQLFSGRDHSTVMSAIEKIEKIVKSDPDLNITIENIYKKM